MGQVSLSTYYDQIYAASTQYKVPSNILEAVLAVESGNGANLTDPRTATVNPFALSKAGAQGIAQFMPDTATDVGLANAYDPNQAIPAAAKYLAQLYKSGGSWDAAIAAYNAGIGNVQKLGITKALAQPGADPDYVKKVEAAANKFAIMDGLPTALQFQLDTNKAVDTSNPTSEKSGASAAATDAGGDKGTTKGAGADPFGIGAALAAFAVSIGATANSVALNVFVGALAIAFIGGGIAWLAASSPSVQEGVGTITGAAVKAP